MSSDTDKILERLDRLQKDSEVITRALRPFGPEQIAQVLGFSKIIKRLDAIEESLAGLRQQVDELVNRTPPCG